MTPLQTIDADLQATRLKWRTAVLSENRAAESVCMRRLDTLLEQRHTVTAATRAVQARLQ